jgi:SAM-dependent methyltransferase
MVQQKDHFENGDYRSLIDWAPRLRREAPFLAATFGQPQGGTIVDLGCGTGEHARWLASVGWHAIGVDSSEKQIESARTYEGEFGAHGPFFRCADMLDLGEVCAWARRDAPLPTTAPQEDPRFAGALCVGNVFPYFEEEDLVARLEVLARHLAPGAPLLVQVLNYQRIRAKGVRSLPLNVRPDPENPAGEVVWLRLLSPQDEEHLWFVPATLQFRPEEEEPLVVRSARRIRVRSWTSPELEALVRGAGFTEFARYGGMSRCEFVEEESHDLVFVASIPG